MRDDWARAREHTFTRYLVAVIAVILGLALRYALIGVIGPTTGPYVTVFPAVVLASWFGGLGPGLISTALSLAGAIYVFIPSLSDIVPGAPRFVGTVTFLVVSVAISLANESLRRTVAQSDKHLKQLTAEVDTRRRAEEALKRSNQELENFAYVASHDLREPLRMVGIYTELLLRRADLQTPHAAEYAGFVREGVTRMDKMITDLLVVSQAIHYDAETTSTADLSAAWQTAAHILSDEIIACGAVIEESNLPVVRGEVDQLSIVFQNLLSNALKYRQKQVSLVIKVSSTPEGEYHVVKVTDNGIGFDQQHAERIFGLFKRLHRNEYPGTGLGLATSRRIVERYGGRIWAEGKLGEGATFYVSLPRVNG